MRLFLIIACCIAWHVPEAWSLPTGAVPLNGGDSFSTSASGYDIDCARINGIWKGGTILSSASAFLTYQADIANKKRAMQTASAAKKAKLKKKIARLKTLKELSVRACSGGFNAQPTPTSSGGSFNSDGSVTAAGKVRFGIPSNLNATIGAGRTIYASRCTGCHGDQLNRTFPQLRSAIRQSPMLFDELQVPDADLANITAYLNRFQP